MTRRDMTWQSPQLQHPLGGEARSQTVITTPTGEFLSLATIEPGSAALTVNLGRITSGKGRLLGYYFGEGKRCVTVAQNGFLLPGVLRTTWVGGERQWTIHLRSARDGQLPASA